MNLIKLSQKDADWNNFRYMSLVCFFRGHYENLAETKDTDKGSLRNEERQKIAHAEHFFGKVIQIEFKTHS
jgi:hypothetical protein